MKRNSGLKRFLLKGLIWFAFFLQWVETHPLINKIVLLIAEKTVQILTRK